MGSEEAHEAPTLRTWLPQLEDGVQALSHIADGVRQQRQQLAASAAKARSDMVAAHDRLVQALSQRLAEAVAQVDAAYAKKDQTLVGALACARSGAGELATAAAAARAALDLHDHVLQHHVCHTLQQSQAVLEQTGGAGAVDMTLVVVMDPQEAVLPLGHVVTSAAGVGVGTVPCVRECARVSVCVCELRWA
jgi:hypothetical protein